jgi:hypothetical protein
LPFWLAFVRRLRRCFCHRLPPQVLPRLLQVPPPPLLLQPSSRLAGR